MDSRVGRQNKHFIWISQNESEAFAEFMLQLGEAAPTYERTEPSCLASLCTVAQHTQQIAESALLNI